MALTKRQMSVVEAIKGKIHELLLLRKQDTKTDLLIKKTVNEISGLIDSHELSEQHELLERIENTLKRLKRNEVAAAFIRKHKKR